MPKRLEAMGQRLSERGEAVPKLADAAKPLYASPNDSQKRIFARLGDKLLLIGRVRNGKGMMGEIGDGQDGRWNGARDARHVHDEREPK